MIWCENPGFVFIHIPRTGGTSITQALLDAYPAARVDNFGGKHATAYAAWCRFGPKMVGWLKFAVLRDPCEIIESDWRSVTAAAKVLPEYRLHVPVDWAEYVERVAGWDFPQFVRNQWLGVYSPLRPGGFWRTWCLGPAGEDLGVEMLRFDRLAEDWRRLCERYGLSDLPWLNVGRATRPAEWTDGLRAAVCAVCWMDYELLAS